MRAIEMFRTSFSKLADFLATLRQESDFTCADCERWERCGLPPDKDCIVRLAQIARDEGRPRIRAMPMRSTPYF